MLSGAKRVDKPGTERRRGQPRRREASPQPQEGQERGRRDVGGGGLHLPVGDRGCSLRTCQVAVE